MTTLQKIKQLEREVTQLKSMFFAIVPLDKEGVYKKTFLNDIQHKRTEKSIGTYRGKGDLLTL